MEHRSRGVRAVLVGVAIPLACATSKDPQPGSPFTTATQPMGDDGASGDGSGETGGDEAGSATNQDDGSNSDPTIADSGDPTTPGDTAADVDDGGVETGALDDGGFDTGAFDEGGLGGECCEPSPMPGCADQAVADCVCAEDAYCCEMEWDGEC
ncbi:MAG TPA: hypothetical protein VFG69_17915, partial [Nannocystaceae bacterium]|nr:hypothetical protein [Nannocystaceae bacterium]